MKTVQLKTNIMCSACVAKVSPALNELAGEKNWKVDLVDPDKTLTVTSEHISEASVIDALQSVGYKVKTS